jgi:hypothetical protein
LCAPPAVRGLLSGALKGQVDNACRSLRVVCDQSSGLCVNDQVRDGHKA